jgi:hypothetical protein
MIIDIYKIPKSKRVCYSCDTELYGSKGKPIIDDHLPNKIRKGIGFVQTAKKPREEKTLSNIWTKSCEHKILYRI